MAINTTNVGAGAVTVYTSSGDSAITFMSFCNHSGSVVSIDVHIIKNGDVLTNDNLFAQGIDINAGDTYILYQGSEKIILSNNDYVSVTASLANAVAVITSYVGL